MSQLVEVKVPDIGDYADVPVIDVFVKVGDVLKVDDAICTLESDKATMDVPSSVAGTVKELRIKVGDRVAEGHVVVCVEASAAAAPQPTPVAAPASAAAPAAASSQTVDVTVPDIGDFDAVPIIELFVKVGDTVKVDDAVCTLESDKATMDVPTPVAGTVSAVQVKLGDKVAKGSVLIQVTSGGAAGAHVAAPAAPPGAAPAPASAPAAAPSAAGVPAAVFVQALGAAVHASPSVRAFARELGADLAQAKPTGPKGRVTREDVVTLVKGAMTTGVVPGKTLAPQGTGGGGGALDLLPWPKVDFAKFGEVEVKPLSRIKKISGANLARNWVMIPAVTFHEDADITDLEAFRVLLNKENEKSGKKLTLLAFLIKAAAKALKDFPEFNSSLDGDNLVYKKYINIAFAADTPQGLMVPVVKNADQKGVWDIAAETGELAKKARDGKLAGGDMSGACFTISSLGGIGGTGFAPIINAPEVAILGVNKSAMKPVWDGKAFVPRLVMPLSLTADHRVIDGAMATRFNVYLAQLLADFRRVML